MTAALVKGGAFLHIPKTGGTWVFNVLSRSGLVRVTIGQAHNFGHHEKWAFTVVRDPVQWWLSLWRQRVDSGFEGMGAEHPLYPLACLDTTDIEVWIDRAAREFPGFCGQLYQQYVGRSKFVLQTEHLAEQLQLLGKKVGWPAVAVDLPRANVSRRLINRDALDTFALRAGESAAIEIWQKAGLKAVENFQI